MMQIEAINKKIGKPRQADEWIVKCIDSTVIAIGIFDQGRMMKFYELTAIGTMHRVEFNEKDDYHDFQHWILDDAPFTPSPIQGGIAHARIKLAHLNVRTYVKTRNYLDGRISNLSPYIEHGVTDSTEILKYIDSQQSRSQAYGFLQQLSWRDFYQKKYAEHPDAIWENLQGYKTGFSHEDYSDQMPLDILHAETDVAVINGFIDNLQQTGYLHNHARLFLAAYIVHWRRVKWQVGAKWMLSFLMDGNLASNNYSWQWVASTGSNKPYIFNLETVQKFAASAMNVEIADNLSLHGSYEVLVKRLFPRLNAS